METEGSETAQLLSRWHAGDRGALDLLLERELPWIEARVRRRLGPLLRAKAETGDLVQEAALELLRYGPRFVLESRRQFRGLLARIVENVLRDEHDRFTAYRRAAERERPLPTDSVLYLDPPAGAVKSPSQSLAEKEWEGLVRLALELLEPPEREPIVLREWDGLSFREIGERLGLSEDAARMRFHRALARLSGVVQRLKAGRLDEILEDGTAADPEVSGGP